MNEATNLPQLRDAKERARERLGLAFADDLIDADELERRIEAVESATTPAQVRESVHDLEPPPEALVPVARNLPATRDPEPERRMTVAFSSAERAGVWAPARSNFLRTVFGASVIDLRDAQLPEGLTEIRIACVFGSVEIIVPPGLAVDVDCTAILGSTEQDPPSVPASGTQRVRVTGWVALGSVEVRERAPGEGGRAARKRRKLALAARSTEPRALPPGDDR